MAWFLLLGIKIGMTWKEFIAALNKPIGAPKGAKGAKAPSVRASVLTDVVGIELGSGDARGCPAVRLTRRSGECVVRAVGFVSPPKGELPSSWKELERQTTWSVQGAFAAPNAAIAVNSPDQIVRQTTLEVLSSELGRKVEPRVPVSNRGLRFTVEPMGDASFVLESGLPEFQVLWLSRLFPEGRRPTAASVQTLPTAMLSSLFAQSAFVQAGGSAAALFVTGSAVYFAGFRDGALVLFREFQGMGGALKVREALKSGFGMAEQMVDEVLDDTLIDPAPILTPVLGPILRQMELSLDYLKNRLGVTVDQVFLMGLSSGAKHWGKMAESMLGVKLVAPDLFAGVEVLPHAESLSGSLKRSHVFMSAYGAARAAMEAAE